MIWIYEFLQMDQKSWLLQIYASPQKRVWSHIFHRTKRQITHSHKGSKMWKFVTYRQSTYEEGNETVFQNVEHV